MTCFGRISSSVIIYTKQIEASLYIDTVVVILYNLCTIIYIKIHKIKNKARNNKHIYRNKVSKLIRIHNILYFKSD